MWYCNTHGIEFDMENEGGCSSCYEEWVAPEDLDVAALLERLKNDDDEVGK
ncbi:hypothetical protein LCGC14_1552290 [marine sediment metagenome]|uniref:Uncharacterized protein n=1 Tax=marine sediment metagenome TaxID=412755 RepID=A0A0F9LQS0_9ZZZZ